MNGKSLFGKQNAAALQDLRFDDVVKIEVQPHTSALLLMLLGEHAASEVREARLNPGPSGLGMQIVATSTSLGTSVCVVELAPDGIAATSELVHENDIILEINGIAASGLCPDEVMTRLSGDSPATALAIDACDASGLRGNPVVLKLFRPTPLPKRVVTVVLAGDGLGIKMSARSNAFYVEKVAKGSRGDESGIAVGDRLVSVNAVKLFGKTNSEVRALLLQGGMLTIELQNQRFAEDSS